MKRVRVLVVDDSATSRLLLVGILRADAGIDVVGEAADGFAAVEMVKRLHPDIVTMDVQMPGLDGFAATKRIMVEAPTPILIITSIDPRALSVSLEAVRVGALAVHSKPRGLMGSGFDEEARELVRQVKAMSRVKVVRHHQVEPVPAPGDARAIRGGGARRAGPGRGHCRFHRRPGGPPPHPDLVARGLPRSHPRRPAHVARLRRRFRRLAGPGVAAAGQAGGGGRGATGGDRLPGRGRPPPRRLPGRAGSISRPLLPWVASGPRAPCSSSPWPRPSGEARWPSS